MRIALALGSGGARGYVHIGVLAELKERGHAVAAIAGTSMGAVVGGLEAVGRLDDYRAWVETLTARDVWLLLDPAFSGPGVFWGRRVMDRVADLLDDALIEDLPIPFTAVATDLTASREVWFQRGSLALAMRASIGIPSVFTPVMMQGRLLADGGILNPVPVDPLLGTPADLTVAVSLSGARDTRTSQQPVSESADSEGVFGELAGRLRRGVLESDQVRGVLDWWQGRFAGSHQPEGAGPPEVAQASDAAPSDFDALPKGLRTTDVVSRSLETSQAMITRFRMAASPPDVLVEFGMDIASPFDFHRAGELIALGRERAARAFDEAGL
ncbi:patatin-like phospholipase family protein [Propioniciclava soli]|uniref:patatin-like phospholipase family protein n=1 Tax=Propioniciclava soli TaxID=2775081 RepID=UPI001E3B647B|nr:patatin-like phospholipase family protein [Propioniciclava soli]